MPDETKLDPTDVQSRSWEGHLWAEWRSLDAAISPRESTAPDSPGWYRIRGQGKTGLIYIGETGRSLRSRFRQLRKAMEYAGRGKYATEGKVGGPPHVAGGCILNHVLAGWGIEVSWAIFTNPDARERKGIECDLIAAYRKATGSNPACQFAGDLEIENDDG